MNKAMFATMFGLVCAATATAAVAGPSLSDAWYVKKDGAGLAMLADRAGCVTEAEQFGVDRATDFSNPEYGSLTALGAALDDDNLHAGAKAAVRRAVRDACMQKHGWTRVDPSDSDVKVLKKTNARHAEALDAWIAAHPPADKPAPAAATPAAPTPAPAKTSDPSTPKP